MVPGKMIYTIERFFMRENSASGLGHEVVLDGWFHADDEVTRMTLALDGNAAPHFTTAEMELPSPDVAAALEPRAANRRFLLVGPVTPGSIPFRRATLCVTLKRGDRCEIDIGEIFRSEVVTPQISYAEVVTKFESLGDSPEFGNLQRSAGVERAGLFRFADCRSAPLLTQAIHDRFAGFAAADALRVIAHDDEWLVADHRFSFVMHTGVAPASMTEAQIREQEATALPLLAQMFLNDIAAGEKIYVRRVSGPDPESGMHDLFHVMRRVGPARLLWVTTADRQHAAGTVTKLEDGLYRGYIADLAPSAKPADVPVTAWTTLLTEALKTIVAPAPAPLRPPRETSQLASDWSLSAPARIPDAGRRPGWRKLFGGSK